MAEKAGITRRAEQAARKIRRLLRDAAVEKPAIDLAKHLIDNTAWMQAKLEDARQAIAESTIAIEYDNGGGQRGIRENPLFRGYEALWRAYVQGMGQILDLVPESEREATQGKAAQVQTPLELIRARREGAS